MKLGVMQPYFFPYLGYFDLIHQTDRWIVFDTVQYIRHGWVNRNRIFHPTQGWQYIIVPIRRHTREAAIEDVRIASGQKWERRIIGQLQHYKKQAPFFDETVSFVQDCLGSEESSLSRLNVSILEKACARLRIRFDYSFFSEMSLELGLVERPGDWALRICEAIGADEYVNPPGGATLFDEEKFRESNIKLTIRNLPPFEYSCGSYKFTPNLSIVDLFMWNEPEKIKRYLDQHR